MRYLKVEKICKIIGLAEICFQRHSESGFQSKYLNEIAIIETDAETKNLLNYMSALSREELGEVVALMVIGRGDGGDEVSDFEDLAKRSRGIEPAYLVSKIELSIYLKDGLQKIIDCQFPTVAGVDCQTVLNY